LSLNRYCIQHKITNDNLKIYNAQRKTSESLGFLYVYKKLIFIIFFKLMLTLMLMAVIVYLYTVIAFNFFRKFYANEEDEHNCKDLFTVGTLF
jgi:hypothetical protein